MSKGGGPPIGLFNHLSYTRETLEVEKGSVLLLYTDGVTEAENSLRELYGLGRLSEFVQAHATDSAPEIHDGIRSALSDFTGDQPVGDDSTIIVLKF